ncbi:hypothetical protein NQZ68_012605 [Dissostichus eleginoides]|nr:hypothetical protein NQZ68_012605 [Dissostichus eleginoides]
MPPKAEDTTVGVGMEAAGGSTTNTPKVDVEDMREEEVEEEEAAEGGRCREAGEKEVEEGEALTTRATIKMQEVIRGEEGEGATEEEGTTKQAFRTLLSTEEAEAVTMTITIRREAGVEEVAGAGEEEAEEQEQEQVEEEEEEQEEQVEEDKVEAGEGEGGRILIKEDSLNSSSNKAGSTTTKLALLKADNTPVEEEWGGIAAESTQRPTPRHVN